MMNQTFLNCVSLKPSVWANNISMVAKIGALIGNIGLGIYAFIHDFHSASASLKQPFEGTILNPGKTAVGFYSALFAYQGWNYLNFIIEEVKNPEKNLPRAILLSLAVVIAVYVFSNVAFFTTMTLTQLVNSPAAGIVNYLTISYIDFFFSRKKRSLKWKRQMLVCWLPVDYFLLVPEMDICPNFW